MITAGWRTRDLGQRESTTCHGFIARAADYFACQGISCIERVITDNHLSYRAPPTSVCHHHHRRQTSLHQTALSPGITANVERFNRTLQTECSYRKIFASNANRAQALALWLEFYNTERRHRALDGLPPISRLRPP
jgi:transposase InsO family protein